MGILNRFKTYLKYEKKRHGSVYFLAMLTINVSFCGTFEKIYACIFSGTMNCLFDMRGIVQKRGLRVKKRKKKIRPLFKILRDIICGIDTFFARPLSFFTQFFALSTYDTKVEKTIGKPPRAA